MTDERECIDLEGDVPRLSFLVVGSWTSACATRPLVPWVPSFTGVGVSDNGVAAVFNKVGGSEAIGSAAVWVAPPGVGSGV